MKVIDQKIGQCNDFVIPHSLVYKIKELRTESALAFRNEVLVRILSYLARNVCSFSTCKQVAFHCELK